MRTLASLVLVVALFSAAGCGGPAPEGDGGPSDGGRADGGAGDAAREDGGAPGDGGVDDDAASPEDAAASDDAAIPDEDAGCGDLDGDPRNCGACGNDCRALPGVAPSIACVLGVCDLEGGCAAGRAHCSDDPVDGCETDLRDPETCGACDVACAEPVPACTASGASFVCASGCSGATPTRCEGRCVDTTRDPAACGGCGMACVPPAHASPTCAASTCGFACDAGYVAVGAGCVAAHRVGGTVTGIVAGTLVLGESGETVSRTADGAFSFPTLRAEGSAYDVTVVSAPAAHRCDVSGGSGVIGSGDVTDVVVTCRLVAVRIDEIHARPATGAAGDANGDDVRDSGDDEFVEVRNDEAFAVDVSGLVLRTGSAAPGTLRYTFPAGSVLAPGQRAVIFGGGTPTGSFGGALVGVVAAASGLALTDAPSSGFSVTLALASGPTIDVVTYDATAFGSSCTTTCASRTRDAGGAFVAHPARSGSAGIRWSPGVAPPDAILKVAAGFSSPPAGATGVSVISSVTVRLVMDALAADLTSPPVRLYASSCAAPAGEVALSSAGMGADASQIVLVPASPLAYDTVHCVVVDGALRQAAGAAMGASASYSFRTAAAASSPADHVVISEVGGCRFSSTSGATACGGTGANDEFVELHNPTAAPIDVSGFSIQRRAAGGTASCFGTLPPGTTIAAHGFLLIGGAGYTASRYGGVAADVIASPGTALTGASESVALIDASGTCTTSTAARVVDSVSAGTITDTSPALRLPALASGPGDGRSIERRACWDSTGDASPATGMLPGGGHATSGNAESLGASAADWITRPTPEPQSSASPVELRTCT